MMTKLLKFFKNHLKDQRIVQVKKEKLKEIPMLASLNFTNNSNMLSLPPICIEI